MAGYRKGKRHLVIGFLPDAAGTCISSMIGGEGQSLVSPAGSGADPMPVI